MHILAEFSALELFDVEHVEVKGGLIRMGRLPRSRFFVWKDPREQHDIVVFIGEAQPPKGRYAFCQRLIEFARQLGIERVYTFAAMATPMHPEHASRVFGAATDAESLAELKRLELEILEDGQIGGLNGVLLGVAAESGLRGACLLGEMPHIFAQLPFPKASLAVLEAFTTIANIQIDLTELSEQAKEVEHKLGELLEKVKEALEEQQDQERAGEEEIRRIRAGRARGRPQRRDRELIERLFRQARQEPLQGLRAQARARPPRALPRIRGPLPRPVQEAGVTRARSGRHPWTYLGPPDPSPEASGLPRASPNYSDPSRPGKMQGRSQEVVPCPPDHRVSRVEVASQSFVATGRGIGPIVYRLESRKAMLNQELKRPRRFADPAQHPDPRPVRRRRAEQRRQGPPDGRAGPSAWPSPTPTPWA